MSIQEFNKTGFGKGMKIIYNGKVKEIRAINFEEALLGFSDETDNIEDDYIEFARCENCTLIRYTPPS